METLTRAVKMYVEDVANWDEYAERLFFALNTAQDSIRGDIPFYLLRDWDPRSTLEELIPLGSTRRRDREPRYRIQRQYQQARERSKREVDRHYETAQPHEVEVGAQIWLYLDRVNEGYARKLAHMWHGPFHVLEFMRLEIAGTEYRLFPVVHVSKL
ncbi:LOW QUALITY PROTEIN: Reverse transcriptase [Phytophthora palmivora]|uniref:Reverse transcriptase n=1 Tax=Phytophthora palmivora TaxID=4796 RepID=A0A2P4Y263_9STRA|nr:LOW QUALITY PROTEIN: Reverse transcriptase [Phytophthora palmivora]